VVTIALREALNKDPRTTAVIARRADISESGLCNFRQGKRGLRATGIDRLAVVLGLTMVRAEK